MDIFPIWKTTYYSSSDTYAYFRITSGGEIVYKGRAARKPDEDSLLINLNKPCSPYLDSVLAPAYTDSDSVIPQNSYREFSLDFLNESSGNWTAVYQFAFFNDWSYERNESLVLNDPINGHASPGQILPATFLNTGSTTLQRCYTTDCGDTPTPPTPEPGDYESQYLTLEITSGGTLVWSGVSYNGVNLEYSTDSGATWGTLRRNTSGITVESGDTVLLRAEAQSHQNLHLTSSTATFNVYGNIMSLLYGDNFLGQTVLPAARCTFLGLFSGTNVKSARHLVLPATTLTDYCYNSMFEGCSSLTDAPALPATTLADSCYIRMFWHCFSLTTAPALPATTLADSCYSNMFSNCYSFTTAPALPATTLADGCYSGMFFACSGLTTAPALPATTLADDCYNAMFRRCTSLTTAPALPATTLANACYYHMFDNCSSLNYVKCLATSFATVATDEWLNHVSSTGTFIKNSGATWDSGMSGIPAGWTVLDA